MLGEFGGIGGGGGVDKVAMVERGLFIVRFHTMENKNKVVQGGYPFFDGKPVIIKAWNQEVDFKRDEIRQIFLWIQLDLEFKH